MEHPKSWADRGAGAAHSFQPCGFRSANQRAGQRGLGASALESRAQRPHGEGEKGRRWEGVAETRTDGERERKENRNERGNRKERPKRKSVTDVCREVSSGETYENTGNCWRSSTGGVSQ